MDDTRPAGSCSRRFVPTQRRRRQRRASKTRRRQHRLVHRVPSSPFVVVIVVALLATHLSSLIPARCFAQAEQDITSDDDSSSFATFLGIGRSVLSSVLLWNASGGEENSNTVAMMATLARTAFAALFVFALVTAATRCVAGVDAFRGLFRRNLQQHGGGGGGGGLEQRQQQKRTTAGDRAEETASPSKSKTQKPSSASSSSPLVFLDSKSIRETLQWWDDLAPPFSSSAARGAAVEVLVDKDGERVVERLAEESDDINDFEDTSIVQQYHQVDADVTHFCFLVHGHRGYARDLAYLQHRMERLAANRIRKQQQQQQQQQQPGIQQEQQKEEAKVVKALASTVSEPGLLASGSDLGGGSTTATRPRAASASSATSISSGGDSRINASPLRHDIIVHSAVCNEKKTMDGVVEGGERLVDEMVTVIREEMAKRRRQRKKLRGQVEEDDNDDDLTEDENGELEDITISILGNSLGGLYGRYALARLAEKYKPPNAEEGQDYLLLDGRYRIHFNVFCTTASPHLGLAGLTFLPIPRTAEIGVAVAMGDTGRDLFRLNDLMKQMATTPYFLEPLAKFRKRVAYANAYGTDFPVPLHTAAFLSETSDYPHHFYCEDNGEDEEDKVVVDDNGLVIATLHTPPNRPSASKAVDEEDADPAVYVDQDDTDDLNHMSQSLDSLGWKKVFIDIRREVPKVPVPSLLRRLGDSRSSSMDFGASSDTNNSDNSGDEGSNNDNSNGNPPGTDDIAAPINRLREKGIVASKDIAAALSSKPLFDQDEFHWPMGHNMMVAFSRSRLSTYMNKAGRPVVDALAKELVDDILLYKPEEE